MYNKSMKNIINASELQRKGLKEIYETIEDYGQAFIVNQRSSKSLTLIDSDSPYLLINIIKSLKGIKDILKKEYNIKKIGIAGSFARGENKKSSDLDIIIDYKIKDLDTLFEIEKLLKKQTKIHNIDLLTIKDISPFALEEINKDVIYV